MTAQLNFLDQIDHRREMAAKRLQKIVDQTRLSFACEQFRRRRAAGKKGWARKAVR